MITVALIAWPLLTFVGIPEDPYSSAPDPCQLVSERTVHAVTAQSGPPRTRDSDDLRGGAPLGLAHKMRQRICDYTGPGRFGGPVAAASVRIWVDWYTSTQFDLGPSGVERAERQLDRSLDAHEVAWGACSYELREVHSNVCGFHYSRFGANVLIQRENVYISVAIDATPSNPLRLPDGWLDQRIADVARDVLAALDTAP